MGTTEYSHQDIIRIISELGAQFTGCSYNLFERNCNHFTDALCQRLVGRSIPGWVNRLAWLGGRMPCFATVSDTDGFYAEVTKANTVNDNEARS